MCADLLLSVAIPATTLPPATSRGLESPGGQQSGRCYDQGPQWPYPKTFIFQGSRKSTPFAPHTRDPFRKLLIFQWSRKVIPFIL